MQISRASRVGGCATALALLVFATLCRPAWTYHSANANASRQAIAVPPASSNASERSPTVGSVPPEVADFGPERHSDVPDRQRIVVERLNSPKDFEIALRLKSTSRKAKAGVSIRVLTPSDYYAVQIDAMKEKIVFARVSHGNYAEIVAVDSDIGDAWHSLSIRAQDNRFSVTLDGRWLFTAYDAVLSRPGRVALWTSREGAVEFDGVSVQPLGPE